jgi:hypothetical protein
MLRTFRLRQNRSDAVRIPKPRVPVLFSAAGWQGEITFAAINSQFDEHAWSHRGNEAIGEMQMAGPRSHSVNARFEVAGRQICVDNFRSQSEQIRMTRCGKDVSAQSDFSCGPGKSLKPRARDQAAGQDQTKIQEKLKADKANEDCSRAMLGEPPDGEEKQDAEQGLITVQDR